MDERRCSSRREETEICKMHPEMEKKIDRIIDNQEQYMGHQVTLAADVASIHAIVNNGLKEKMGRTITAVNALEERMAVLDDFQWFRVFVNETRDKFFTKVIKWAFIGGILVFFLSAFFVGGEKFWRLLLK